MPDSLIDGIIAQVSNWGRWGADDELGTVNYITQKVIASALEVPSTGKAFALSIPFDLNGPQPSFERRLNPRHVMLQTGSELRAGVQEHAIDGWGYADDMVCMALQCATHWDGLSHAFYDYKMYNDRSCELVGVTGATRNSITAVASRIVTRGLLLDVPRALDLEALPPGHEITVAEIETTLEKERVEPRSGDILLIRTGHMAAIRKKGSWDGFTYADEPGIGLACLPWLHELEVAGLASDNWAFEVLPNSTSIMLPVHAAGIVHMGLLLGEIFALDELAADCASDGIYQFLLCGLPLPFTRAVGAPVNPLALK